MSYSRDNSRLRVGGASKSRSRPGSRPRASRNASVSSVPYLPLDPQEFISPDAPIGEEAAELLQEFVRSRGRETDHILAQETAGEEGLLDGNNVMDGLLDVPWWKRPSPWWFLVLIPVDAIAIGATLAPRVSVYTRLACDAYKPEYTRVGWGSDNDIMQFAHVNDLAFPFVSSDDEKWALCASDPVVQAAVAKLSLIMTASMGILSCLTTAFWGSLSDRYGRIRVMSICIVGAIFTEVNFLFVYRFPKAVPGGLWFLVVGPVIDGLLGGIGAIISAINAYLADCTDLTARSRIFSLFTGIVFTGMSLGPTLGSLTIKFTGNIMSVFYITLGMHLVFSLFLWLLIPESSTVAQREEARNLYATEQAQLAITRAKGGILTSLGRLFGFLRPLSLFYPTIIDDKPGKKRRDWSLLLIVAAFGCSISLMGGITYKMQYMSSVFGWTAQDIGYWSSSIIAARAIHLTLVLPLTIKLFQPKTPAIQLPVEPSELLHPDADCSETSSPSVPPPHHRHSTKFDLMLARCSLLIEISSYTLMACSKTGGLFTVFSIMSSFGAGYGPAVSSIASALYAARGGKEMGKLFGAISVVQTLCSQVLGPSIFALAYMATVATFPSAIFFLSAGMLCLSFLLFLFVRLPKASQEPPEVDVEDYPRAGDPLRSEGTPVDIEELLIVVDDEEGDGKMVSP